ncbi:MAG: transglutaminase family protein [Rhodospirillales bacterium]|nr:transglutaminase family protein [Rhodospirillales bacterium]
MSQSWPPAAGRNEIVAALAVMCQGGDEEIRLAEAALLLAALDRPQVGLARYRDHLADIAAGVAAGRADNLEQRRQLVNRTLFEELGYAGDRATYDDLQNANLMRVIDRRRGLPVALSILYLHAMRAQGWEAEALRFPGHVVVRLGMARTRMVVDPFAGGRRLEPQDLRRLAKAVGGVAAEVMPAHVEAMTNREILVRLQNNIKVRRLQNGDREGGLAALESMLRLLPGAWPLWREAASLHIRIGNLHAATLALQQVLDLADGPEARFEAAQALQVLKSKLN